MLCRFPLSRFNMHSQIRPDKLFWKSLKQNTFAFFGNELEHLERAEKLCFQRPKKLNVSTGPSYKILMERIHFLYDNLYDCLYAATNKSIKNRSERRLRLNNSQLSLIKDTVAN